MAEPERIVDYAIRGASKEWTEGRVQNALADPLNEAADLAPPKWEARILVPFCVESALSGVGRVVRPDQTLWYRRTFEVPDDWAGQRLLLHFQAVDWHAVVWLNGEQVGEHRGGYDPFTLDITDALQAGDAQELIVAVWDPTNIGDQAVGKQSLPERQTGFRYTASSGIWQSVWLEPVPVVSIARVKIVPDVDLKGVRVGVRLRGASDGVELALQIRDGDLIVASERFPADHPARVGLDRPKLWTPDLPYLYDLKLQLLQDGKIVDEVDSYFGMRRISLGKDERGVTRLLLNDQPLFQYGPLDQGYWPDGINTPPTDEAAAYDVKYLKRIGCNMVRVHVTQHPDRWYYHCDRLGLLVWQDMVCTRKFESRITEASAAQWEQEQARMIDYLHNHPSIVMWVVFNEGWGQYDTERLTQWAERYDPTRLLNNASGWTDFPVGHVLDLHDYSFHGSIALAQQVAPRAIVLGEVGGFDVPVAGHLWHPDHPVRLIRDPIDESGREKYTSSAEWARDYQPWLEGLRALIPHGLCAAVYTQISDVEHEPNGWLTYDREISKIAPETLKQWHARLYEDGIATQPILPAAEGQPVLWRYTTDRTPPDDWAAADFDDTGWSKGSSPFGTGGEDLPAVSTSIDAKSLRLRSRFHLDAVPARPAIRVISREPVEVYLNGKLVKGIRHRCRGDWMFVCDAPLRDDMRDALRTGENTIAVRVQGKAPITFLDVGLVALPQ